MLEEKKKGHSSINSGPGRVIQDLSRLDQNAEATSLLHHRQCSASLRSLSEASRILSALNSIHRTGSIYSLYQLSAPYFTNYDSIHDSILSLAPAVCISGHCILRLPKTSYGLRGQEDLAGLAPILACEGSGKSALACIVCSLAYLICPRHPICVAKQSNLQASRLTFGFVRSEITHR